VAPISRELTDLAQAVLGDKRMVSDIVQPSVHKVWYRHRHKYWQEAGFANLIDSRGEEALMRRLYRFRKKLR
jgi:DNA-directed RNA polymerase specialized sigma24 family protein